MKRPACVRIVITILFGLCQSVAGQHRGDNLAFQGLVNSNTTGVRAVAMGSAFTAISGDLNALFYNPAGLADIDRTRLSFSAHSFTQRWRENQTYRPNRFEITLPFYLEGLYIPNPANNGKWDYEIFEQERDSTYIVQEPVLGKDPFGKEAADWETTTDEAAFSYVAAALPVEVAGRKLVLSAAFSKKNDLLDFDRNDTYLDPHIGFDGYGIAQRVTNDTLHMNWYRFLRDRSGAAQNITAAAGYSLHANVNVGIALHLFSGETDDRQVLDRVGWFDIARNNRFRFSYDTLLTQISGTSKFSSTRLTIGAQWKLNRVRVGVSFATPYTLTREWDYTTSVTDTAGTVFGSGRGSDEMEVPATLALGICFTPVDRLRLAVDIEHTPYRNAEFRFAIPDSTHRQWVDQTILRFGASYRAASWLVLLAGYQNVPATFVPDGAAFRDRGPAAESYTAGVSLILPVGRLDAAYERRTLKYYDSYFSNTNYALTTFANLALAYTINLK